MSSIVEGLANQVWLVAKMESLDKVWEERIPANETTETAIIAKIEDLAKTHLTQREIIESPSLFTARSDQALGNRLIFEAGENPYYVASLWRSDELAK